MHMDDLWFDMAIRGEPDLQDNVVERFHLSDGTEPESGAAPPALDPAPEDTTTGGLRPAPVTDCF
jgi:hypothetical protein